MAIEVNYVDHVSLGTTAPDGFSIPTIGGNYVASIDSTGYTVRVWKIAGGSLSEIGTPLTTAPSDAPHAIALSADGAYMAVPTYKVVSGDVIPSIEWYKRSGDTFAKLSPASPLTTVESFDTIDNIYWTGDGAYIAGTFSTPSVVWFKRTGDTFTQLPDPTGLVASSSLALAWSPDGVYLAASYDNFPSASSIVVYKRTGDTLAKLSDIPTHTGLLSQHLAWSSDGEMLIASGVDDSTLDPLLRAWKRTGDTFTLLSAPITSNYFGVLASAIFASANDPVLAIGATDDFNPLIEFHEKSGDSYALLSGEPDVLPPGGNAGWWADAAFSGNKVAVLFAGYNSSLGQYVGNELYLYEIAAATASQIAATTGDDIARFTPLSALNAALEDATAGVQGSAAWISALSGVMCEAIAPPPPISMLTGGFVAQVAVVNPVDNQPEAVLPLLTDSFMATWNLAGPVVEIYSRTGPFEYTASQSIPVYIGTQSVFRPFHIGFSPNARYLAISGDFTDSGEFYPRVFKRGEDDEFELLTTLGLQGTTSDTSFAHGVSFSPEGRYLAVWQHVDGSSPGQPFALYKRTGDDFTPLSLSIPNEEQNFNYFEWSSDGAYVVAVGEGGDIFVYKRTGDSLAKLAGEPGDSPGYMARFTPDDAFLITGNSANNTVLNVYQRTGDDFAKVSEIAVGGTLNSNLYLFFHRKSGTLFVSVDSLNRYKVFLYDGAGGFDERSGLQPEWPS